MTGTGVDLITPPTLAPASRVRPPRLWRWVLLAGVISGILGMHVLTGGDMTAGHGPLPSAGHVAQMQPGNSTGVTGMDGMDAHSSAVGVAATLPTGGVVAVADAWLSQVTGGMSHEGMGACILFLVVGGAALLLALLAGRAGRPQGRAEVAGGGLGSGGVMRRGPPGPGLPRLALCVYRI